jgi:hypothetical protein
MVHREERDLHKPHSFTELAEVEIDNDKVFSCSKVLILHPLSNDTRYLLYTEILSQCHSSGRSSLPLVGRSLHNRTICTLFRSVFSITMSDYAPKRQTSCGDPKKPLVRYDLNAQRNRLRQDIFTPLNRNSSQINFGDKYARQFVTTSQNMFGGETGIQSANRSIVASKVKFYHTLQSR